MSLISTATLNATAATPAIVEVPTLAGQDVYDASLAIDTVNEVIVPKMTRPFRKHQGAAYNYVIDSLDRWNAALLGDDMGLGKTQVALAVISERLRRVGGKVLVIAPNVTLAGYKKDIAAAFPHLTIEHLYGRTPYAPQADSDVLFMGDDPLTLKNWLTFTVEGRDQKDTLVPNEFARSFTMLVRDEIHRDKGTEGRPTTRAKVMLSISEFYRQTYVPMLGLTGTLLTNRPIEGLIPLKILGGEDLVKAVTPGATAASGYMWRYCGAQRNRFGTTFSGANLDRIPELHDALRRTVYCRREKLDLGDALPNSNWVVSPFALQGRAMKRAERIEKEFLALIEEEQGPAAMWRMSRAKAITQMTAMWVECGNAKAVATVEYVTDLVENNKSGKAIVFYMHQSVHDALLDGLSKVKLNGKPMVVESINGKVTKAKREQVIADYQDGETNVLLCQIQAAGVGVTLTAGEDAVFAQVPWSAGDLKQAADRILRTDDISVARAERGEGVTWHVLQAAYADGGPSFDMMIWGVLERKAKVCDMVNAGVEVTMPEGAIMKQAMELWYQSARNRHSFAL